MNTLSRKSITLVFLSVVTYGCDTDKKTATTPVINNPGSTNPTIPKPTPPPGESGNRITQGFRNSTVNMDTDLKTLRLQGNGFSRRLSTNMMVWAMARSILIIKFSLVADSLCRPFLALMTSQPKATSFFSASMAWIHKPAWNVTSLSITVRYRPNLVLAVLVVPQQVLFRLPPDLCRHHRTLKAPTLPITMAA